LSTRHDNERLADIIDAIAAIRSHLTRGDLSDGLIFDAVRLRLIEIGEAVKLLDPKLVASEPNVKWSDAAGMRDWLDPVRKFLTRFNLKFADLKNLFQYVKRTDTGSSFVRP